MSTTLAATHEVIGHLGAPVQALLLAHQGGWDELLMVLVPVALFAGLLYMANQRAGRLAARGRDVGQADDRGDGSDSPTPQANGGPPREVPRNERGGPI
jgi:hypothetical protein